MLADSLNIFEDGPFEDAWQILLGFDHTWLSKRLSQTTLPSTVTRRLETELFGFRMVLHLFNMLKPFH